MEFESREQLELDQVLSPCVIDGVGQDTPTARRRACEKPDSSADISEEKAAQLSHKAPTCLAEPALSDKIMESSPEQADISEEKAARLSHKASTCLPEPALSDKILESSPEQANISEEKAAQLSHKASTCLPEPALSDKILESSPEQAHISDEKAARLRHKAAACLAESALSATRLESSREQPEQVSPTGDTVCTPSSLSTNPRHAGVDSEANQTHDEPRWSESTRSMNSSQSVFTSEERPLTVACIDLPPPSGELDDIQRMVGFCMALGRTKQKDGYAWARDLQQDIMRLRHEYRADVLVTMMPKSELNSIGAKDLPQIIQSQGMEWLQFEIVDKFVPTQGVGAFKKMADALAERLRRKKRVVLHCNGGKGRSAMMTAAVVHAYTQGTDKPLTMEQAIAKVRASSTGGSGALRNPVQVAYLYSCEYDPGKLVSSAKQWLRSFQIECA